MSQRKTEHPLRTVVLQYDNTKTETDYEKKLISDFILLHDKAVALKQQRGKLFYEYQLLDDRVSDAEKALAPIAEKNTGFLNEAIVMVEKVKDKDGLFDLNDRMHDYNLAFIQPFHAEIVTPVADTCTALDKELEVYEDAVEKFWKELEANEADSIELYKQHEKYSLDIGSFDDEQEAFREAAQGLFFDNELDEMSAHYTRFINTLNKSYGEIKETQRLLSNYFDDKGLLDNSLSASVAAGNTGKEKSPLYLIAPDDKRIESFPLGYGLLANSQQHTLTVSVPIEAVKQGDVFMLQDLIMQMQHFPKMIEKYIFAIEVSFLNSDNIAMPEDDWKGHAIPVKWFNKLNSMPCLIFFIQDHDARAYMLMGDLLVDGKLSPAHEGEAVMAEGEAAEEIQNRLFHSCWFFLLYCHNTGFDPEPYIEAIMSDFEAAFTYEEVKKKYEGDVAAGIQLRVVPQKNGKPLNPEGE